jgi:hypothetical protein
MVEDRQDHKNATGLESPPPERRNLGREFRAYVIKVGLIFLTGLIVHKLFSEHIADFQSIIDNLNPLTLFSTYIDYLLRHTAMSGDYGARVARALNIPDFLGFLAAKIITISSILVTPFTSLYFTAINFFHQFHQNPFNVIYGVLELLIGGLIAIPRQTYLPFGGYPRLFVRVVLMVLLGSLIGCWFYGMIWAFGKALGLLVGFSMGIPFALELIRTAVEERVHWVIALFFEPKGG